MLLPAFVLLESVPSRRRFNPDSSLNKIEPAFVEEESVPSRTMLPIPSVWSPSKKIVLYKSFCTG